MTEGTWNPTPYHSHTRNSTNGRPCWLGTDIVLPDLQFRPTDGDPETFDVKIIHQGSQPGAFTWADKPIAQASVGWLLRQFREDPERVLVEFFNQSLPRGTRWVAPLQTPASLEDMGL